MALSDDKLRKIVNMLSDPLQAHAAAHLLAGEAKEQGILVADLIAKTLTPTARSQPQPQAAPAWNSVKSKYPFDGAGRPINRDVYGLQSFVAYETDKAWLLLKPELDWGDPEAQGEDIWLPKSQCEHHGEDPDGRSIFTVPMWLARKKGFL